MTLKSNVKIKILKISFKTFNPNSFFNPRQRVFKPSTIITYGVWPPDMSLTFDLYSAIICPENQFIVFESGRFTQVLLYVVFNVESDICDVHPSIGPLLVNPTMVKCIIIAALHCI